MRDHFYTPFLQLMLPNLLFNKIKCKIQQHCNDAEDHNGHQDPCKPECLASVNDQVSQAFSGTDKFSDDHAHQTEPDIDLHGADDRRNAAWDHDFGEGVEPVPVEGVDQHDLIRVDFGKFGIEVQYASEDRNGHSGNDDGCAVCAEPDNKQRGKGGFWQAVQHHQIRLQDFGKLPKEPEKDGDKKAEEDYQDKTDQGFVKSHSDMTENTAVTGHFQKTQGNPGRTAENERVD